MNFTTIGSIFDEAENEFEPQEMKEPVEFIGNFAHSKSRKCENLITEAATILEEYGWRNEFAMYYHKDKTQVRLYLRMDYVASCYLDGTWDNIKERIPYIIPLLLATIELRQEKNLGVIWIDRQVTKLDWSKPEGSMNV